MTTIDISRNKFRDVLFLVIHKKKRTKNDVYSEIIQRIECLMYNEVVRKCVLNEIRINSQSFIDMYNEVTYNELDKIRNKIFNEDRGMVRIGAAFVRFLNERSESDINIEQMNIPLYLTDQVTRRFAEWKTILED